MTKKEQIIKYAKENENINIDYLCSKFEISRQYAVEILTKNGFREKRNKTEEKWKEIIDKYIQGKSLECLSKEYNITKQGIRYQLNKRKIDIRPYTPYRKDDSLDEQYFEILDTPEKMYIVGFLMADGSVTKTGHYQKKPNRISVNISMRDKEIIEFIQEQFKTKQQFFEYIPKNTYSTHSMCRISINSQKMCSDLCKYGIVPNKTGKEYISNYIANSELLPHFIRGFFDGDGSVYNPKVANWSYFSFCSNYKMLEQIVSLLKNKYGFTSRLSITKDKRHSNIHKITITSKHDVKLFYELIYPDNTFCLKRKKNKVVLPTNV